MNELLLALTLYHALPSSQLTAIEPKSHFVSIHAGNTQTELLKAYGEPESMSDETSIATGLKYRQFVYRNDDLCVGISCSEIVRDGLVTQIIGVKPSFQVLN